MSFSFIQLSNYQFRDLFCEQIDVLYTKKDLILQFSKSFNNY